MRRTNFKRDQSDQQASAVGEAGGVSSETRLLDTLVEAAKRDWLSFVLIGGYAVKASGEHDQLNPVVLLVLETQRTHWATLLARLGCNLTDEYRTYFRYSPAEPGGRPIDLAEVAENTFSAILTDSQSISFGGKYQMRIPSTEHLLALQLHLLQQVEGDLGLRGTQDILALVRLGKLDPYTREFRSLCEKYGNIELYKKLLKAAAL